nr:serine-threonine/tyrosine-protein kinase catalytic domain-containing protein [Tanacetum cinerariifolium]
MRPATAIKNESALLWPGEVCRHFSLDEIKSATRNFNKKLVIGRGGFGDVYKAKIKNGLIDASVAVKRLHLRSSQGAPEFWAEVEMLSKLRHCNLVSLIGYCHDESEMVLVYEYMQHGTLEDQLRRADKLSWLQRLRICIEAARGLDYLHTGTGTRYGVIHRDVKTSNILLDENLTAKISDFGLAKISPINQAHSYVSTRIKGTFGYMDPSYVNTGKLTRKSDVYAFGVVLLEVLCGRRAVDTTLDEKEWGLATWAQHCITKGRVARIVDCTLHGQISAGCLKEFASITSCCLHENPIKRPMMAEVVTRLVSLLSLQERIESSSGNTTFIKLTRALFLCRRRINCNNYIVADETDGDIEASDEAGDLNAAKMEREASSQLMHVHASFYCTFSDVLCAPAEQICWNSYSSIYRVLLDDASKARRPTTVIDWPTRMKIIVGITRGLVYLHATKHMIHGNLTSSNVLLDKNYNPFIVDIGHSRHRIDARPESPYNHAPELLYFHEATMETDVYSLGLIMLELLTGKSVVKEEWTMEIFDPEIMCKAEIEEELLCILYLAMNCMCRSPKDRLKADEVLMQLEEIVGTRKAKDYYSTKLTRKQPEVSVETTPTAGVDDKRQPK